ncbi:MAG: hypothetical protein H6684_03250 [Deltaproteobacteria bacterium]|nr:hypothetical protein [bacterium]MCB9480003.1 hypothetical protein [Deltaproteobacteria bacterium]MCB9487730.1 hypothetical protein [Deltaproteobacteria bacterium]
MHKKFFAILTILTALTLMAPLAAMAEQDAHPDDPAEALEYEDPDESPSGEHDSEHGGHHATPVGEIIAAAINFAIFLALIVKFGGGAIKDYYKTRADELNAAVTEAEAALAKANAMFDEVSARFNASDKDAEGVIASATENAQRHADQVIADAEKHAQRILKDAEATIAAETARMTEELKRELSAQVVGKTREKLESRVDDAKRQDLVGAYLNQVEEA